MLARLIMLTRSNHSARVSSSTIQSLWRQSLQPIT